MERRLLPELFTCVREGACKGSLRQDIVSGIIVGIVALPLAIAFAIASGLKPEQGLYTAIIAGFLISALGGSKVQIGGPTGAFIVVVLEIVQTHGYTGLAIATMMAGIILIGMGIFKLGAAIKFIPYPMTIGFTGGIALIIASTQIQPLLGLKISPLPDNFHDKIISYITHIGTADPATLAISGAALAIILIWPKVTKKIPGSIIAIIVTTIAVTVLDLPVATIGSVYGEVPSSLPAIALPDFTGIQITKLIPAAITIALLAAIESLLSAVVADGMTGQRHRSNAELMAQGVANFFSPLFGGLPATGAIARTATNVKNGGTTPIAGMTHALTLLLILIFFGRWATLIPLATLSAILLVVAYHMSEWRVFVRLFRSPLSDIAVMLTTFLLTVFIDLTVAIETGIVASALLFMYRMANMTEIRNLKNEIAEQYSDAPDEFALHLKDVPAEVEVFEIFGPFFFGAANHFKDTLKIVGKKPKVLILRMRSVMSMDATAMRALEDVYEKTQKEGIQLVLSGIAVRKREMLEKFGFVEKLGAEFIYPNIDEALEGAKRLVGQTPAETQN